MWLLTMLYLYVQLAPRHNNSAFGRAYAGVRWSQTYGYGYVPNDKLQRFFMAVAMDTPDFGTRRKS